MKKKINKKKIVTYAAAGLLTATITTGIGLHIYDSNIDHTQGLCPLTNYLGASHQYGEMVKYYEEKGIDAIVYHQKRPSGEYEEMSLGSDETVSFININGHIVYTKPLYYPVTDSDGTIKYAYEIGNPTVFVEIIDDYVVGYRFNDNQEDAIKLSR